MATTATKRRVLIADDSPEVIRALTMLLRVKGYDVIAARNGTEALAEADLARPELIVMTSAR